MRNYSCYYPSQTMITIGFKKQIKGLYKFRVPGKPDGIIRPELRLMGFDGAVNKTLRLRSGYGASNNNSTSALVLQND